MGFPSSPELGLASVGQDSSLAVERVRVVSGPLVEVFGGLKSDEERS
jgi:hypothetical protein